MKTQVLIFASLFIFAPACFAQVSANTPPTVVHAPGALVTSQRTPTGDVTTVAAPGVGVYSDTTGPVNRTSVRVPGLRIQVDETGTQIGGPFGGTWIRTNRDPNAMPVRRFPGWRRANRYAP